MRKFLALFAGVLLALTFARPASAAVDCAVNPALCNCIAIVFHDPTQTNPNDLYWEMYPWADIAKFQRSANRHKLAYVFIYYHQFGAQGGPTAEDMTGASYTSELSLIHTPATAAEPEEISFGRFDPAAGGQQSRGTVTVFTGAANSSSDVAASFPIDEAGANADVVLVGSRLGALIGTTDESVSARARALGLRATVGEIWTELTTNGCP